MYKGKTYSMGESSKNVSPVNIKSYRELLEDG